MKIKKSKIKTIIQESYLKIIKESLTARQLRDAVKPMIYGEGNQEFEQAMTLLDGYASGGGDKKIHCLRILTGFIEEMRKIINTKRIKREAHHDRVRAAKQYGGERMSEEDAEISRQFSREIRKFSTRKSALEELKQSIVNM